ncbi:peptidylprolyl isomerase [Thiosocius teredinicola]|uniref:peptidylprolyl isomerase n=1 Tax=Thiosocius teredinicola TaxID=1973002 RepID=UPI0009910893
MKSTLLSAIGAFVLLFSACASAQPQSVLMKTNKGDIVIELDAEKAPKTVANFLEYVNAGFYNGVIFHRVIEDFMIQGGGFTPDMQQKTPREPVENEAKNGLKNERGTIAMARTSDPHSATAQFFINHKDNPNLDYPSFDGWGYAVFGRVTEGMDVVDTIAETRTGVVGGYRDVPRETILIESVSLIQADTPAGQ